MPGNLFADKQHKEWIDVYGEELVAILSVLKDAGEKDAANCFRRYWPEAIHNKRCQRRIALNKSMTILSPAAQDGKWHVLLCDLKGFTQDVTCDGITPVSSGVLEIPTEGLSVNDLEALVDQHIRLRRSGCHLGRDYNAYFCETKEHLALAASYEEGRCNSKDVFDRDFKGADWYFFLVLQVAPSEPVQYSVKTLSEQKLAFEQFLQDYMEGRR